MIDELNKAFEKTEPDPEKRKTKSWEGLCQTVLAANEFIYLQ